MNLLLISILVLVLFLILGQLAYRVRLKNDPTLDIALKNYLKDEKKRVKKLYYNGMLDKSMLSTAKAIDSNATHVTIYTISIKNGLKSKDLSANDKNQLRKYWREYRASIINQATLNSIGIESKIDKLLKQINIDTASLIKSKGNEIDEYYNTLSGEGDKKYEK